MEEQIEISTSVGPVIEEKADAVQTFKDWKRIISDAKQPKSVSVTWNGEQISFLYKELIGREGDEIERKFPPTDISSVASEKAFVMISKATPSMSRTTWEELPSQLRNIMVGAVFGLFKADVDFFQKLQEQTEE